MFEGVNIFAVFMRFRVGNDAIYYHISVNTFCLPVLIILYLHKDLGKGFSLFADRCGNFQGRGAQFALKIFFGKCYQTIKSSVKYINGW